VVGIRFSKEYINLSSSSVEVLMFKEYLKWEKYVKTFSACNKIFTVTFCDCKLASKFFSQHVSEFLVRC
jgi:hypothetical protein